MADPVLLIDKTVNNIKHVFWVTGINIKFEKTRMDKYRSWLLYFFNSIWLNYDIVGSVLWFLDALEKNGTFTELTFVAPCTIFCCLVNTKTFCLVVNESRVDLLIANIRQLEIQQKKRNGSAIAENIIKTEDDYLNKVIRVLNIVYIALIVSFALNPMLLTLLKYITTKEVEMILPFLILYPFDPYDMRYYPWVYLHQVWSEVVVLQGLFAADCMFYIFCTYLSTQFLLLGDYIENLILPDTKLNEDDQEIKLKLIEFIKWHQQIISSVELLESLYTKSTLFNFASSSVLICFTGFNLMVTDDPATIPTFLCFLLINLLQIFFQCFFGDMIMRSSTAVGDAIFNSRWYLADLPIRKTMLIILIRAQTPCKLTAYKFADVNINAFMKSCSTAWSYFALLRTIYTGPTE